MTYWTSDRIIAAIQEWEREHGEPPKAREWARATPGHPAYITVNTLFGRWNLAIEAAGFVGRPAQAPGAHKRWNPDLIAEAFLDFLLREGRWPTTRDCGVPIDGRSHRVAGLPDWRTVYRRFPSWADAKRYAGWVETPEDESSPAVCTGCGCDFDTYSIGCDHCKWRRAARAARARKQPSTVAAPHLVEPVRAGSEGGVSGAPHGAATPLANHNRGEAEAPAAQTRRAA